LEGPLKALFSASACSIQKPISISPKRVALQVWARNLERSRRELVGRYGEQVFRLFQVYLWGGAHLHRDGGLEAYRAVFQRARDLPSADIGLGGGTSGPS
jgi:cyclopropane fatty-acyl-phospholipid synthase-like methyltransferase